MEVSSQGDGGGRGGYYVRVPPGELTKIHNVCQYISDGCCDGRPVTYL
jgi:hypothetical protein